MLRIGICMGDSEARRKLEDFIHVFLGKEKVGYEVEVFRNGADFFSFSKGHVLPELLFLDTDLGDMTGIEIGQQLRADMKNEVMQLIFISEKERDAMRIFALRPMNFLLKPVSQTEISFVLGEYLRLYGKNPRFFQYSFGKHTSSVLLSQITFFQCCGKKVAIEMLDGTRQEFYGRMQDVAERVENQFFCQIHKSYIVNIKHIAKCRLDQIVLMDGTVLPVSRAYKKRVAERLARLSN